MDPVSAFSIAASALGVADYASTVLIKLYRYYLDVKTATATAAQLREEVGIMFSLLNALVQTLESPIPRETHSELDRAVNGLSQILAEIDGRVTPEATQGFRRLKWPFGQDETERFLARLERFKSIFNLTLNLEHRSPTSLSSCFLTIYSRQITVMGDAIGHVRDILQSTISWTLF